MQKLHYESQKLQYELGYNGVANYADIIYIMYGSIDGYSFGTSALLFNTNVFLTSMFNHEIFL